MPLQAPSTDAVEEQLARILASQLFSTSDRLSAFLEYVVHKTLQEQGADIKEYAVATEVFHRPASFDPRLDTIVRVQASKLRSRLAEYYATSGASDPLIIEIPRGSYVPQFRVRGARRAPRDWVLWTIAGMAGAALALAFVFRSADAPADPQPLRFTILPPENMAFNFAPDISPDGRRIVASVANPAGVTTLWRRTLDAENGHILTGMDGAGPPKWSLDGQSILFHRSSKLHRMDITSAVPAEVIEGPVLSFGVDLNGDGVLLFAKEGDGIGRMPISGGKPSTITKLDRERGEISHYWPWFSAAGQNFLYFARSRTPADSAVYVASLDGRVRKRLLTGVSRAQYARSGPNGPTYLLYVRERTLFAHRIDTNTMELLGSALPVVQGMPQLPYGAASFSASQTGILVYVSQFGWGGQFTWFDRSGKQLGTLGPPGDCGDPTISPDGKTVAFNWDDEGNRDIWVADVATGHTRRLTFDPEIDHTPVWSGDSKQIAFDAHRLGLSDVYVKPADGAAADRKLLTGPDNVGPQDWTRDGRFLVLSGTSRETRNDIWICPTQSGGKPVPYLNTKANEVNARLSPDNRWLAYTSDESGREEVYVQAFADASAASGGKYLVSTGGGSQPEWRGDGKELYFLAPDNALMAASVAAGAAFKASRPRKLFAVPTLARRGPRSDYDVLPDGSRFLVRVSWQSTPPAPLHVFLNWPAALKTK